MELSNVDINKLPPLLDKAKEYGMDVTDIEKKVDDAIDKQKKGIVQIVLLGSFSDGKTSVIAGLLGRKTKDMKIDIAESSDELEYYHLDGVDKKYVIVDTPGLFGTKEKEVDGKNIKYSDLTKDIISNADLLIYVCSAINPIKDSHVPSLKVVLRTFGKLKSTIFVLNKMDEAGVDMDDEEEYEDVSAIKKKSTIKRLIENFQLTDEEVKDLKIACVSADPNRKGFDYWGEHKDEYLRLSHMQVLRNYVDEVISSKSAGQYNKEALGAVAADSIVNLAKKVNVTEANLSRPLQKSEDLLKNMKADLEDCRRDLVDAKGTMSNRLTKLQDGLLGDIDSCTDMEQLGHIVESQIGVEDKKVTGYILIRNINQIFSECTQANNSVLSTTSIEFGDKINLQNELLKSAKDKAVVFLGQLKIDNKLVLKIRDIALPNFKFKPYGAVKFANKMNIALAIGGAIWEWISVSREKKKFKEAQENLKNVVKEPITGAFSDFNDDDTYYKNFAPAYIDMKKEVDRRQKFLDEMNARCAFLEDFKNLISNTVGVDFDDIEDADFEEI